MLLSIAPESSWQAVKSRAKNKADKTLTKNDNFFMILFF
ncbi:hypothetical protein MARINOS108_10286 [Marinoscillum sp. 108]|nr:hypothetical protein MARINOS108_10286 [Marinoscillum sp. 108]